MSLRGNQERESGMAMFCWRSPSSRDALYELDDVKDHGNREY